ncbi:hypothetical protein QUC31_007990 [Theobroma cacao]|uniref:pectinesterase n=1 Tax=Theobroma cacao TaxID=3641 RepID=A0A061G0K0_THECC|nr:Plant invertase/pectin methylesterase inhibitor superfamily protein, putative [Theobroma cacao]
MEAKSLTMSSSSLHLLQVLLYPFSILLLMSNMQKISAAATTKANSTGTYKNFIKTACNTTRYPKECNKALSPYASTIKTDPQKLCDTALSLTLNATCNTSSSIESLSKMKGLSPSETEIIRDCSETVGDAIDELTDSLKAMARAQGSERRTEMGNVRTWVSAALTNEYTCTDEFEGQKVSKTVKNTMKKSVMYLTKMTSNCLALLNLLDY